MKALQDSILAKSFTATRASSFRLNFPGAPFLSILLMGAFFLEKLRSNFLYTLHRYMKDHNSFVLVGHLRVLMISFVFSHFQSPGCKGFAHIVDSVRK